MKGRRQKEEGRMRERGRVACSVLRAVGVPAVTRCNSQGRPHRIHENQGDHKIYSVKISTAAVSQGKVQSPRMYESSDSFSSRLEVWELQGFSRKSEVWPVDRWYENYEIYDNSTNLHHRIRNVKIPRPAVNRRGMHKNSDSSQSSHLDAWELRGRAAKSGCAEGAKPMRGRSNCIGS
jgi:hypothetical protein